MRQLLALSFLLVAGCGGMSEAERRAACSDVYDSGGDFYTVVETDGWTVGDLPLWSSPEQLRAQLGAPDTSYQELVWTDVFGVMVFVVEADTLGFTTVRDSLAYPGWYPLRLGPLAAGPEVFEAGDPASKVERAFPESWRCRNWPLAANLSYLPYDTEVFVDDTTGGGRIAFWLRNDSLLAVGVDSHFDSMDDRVRSRRSD